MTDDGVHTVPRDGAWVNEVLGLVVGGSFGTREEAEEAGREEARRRGVTHRVDPDGSTADSGPTGGLPEPGGA